MFRFYVKKTFFAPVNGGGHPLPLRQLLLFSMALTEVTAFAKEVEKSCDG